MKIRLANRISDLLFVSRGLDAFFIAIWTIFAAWGWTSIAFGVPAIYQTLGPLFNTVWAASIAVASTVAALAAFSLFIEIPHLSQVRKKQIELSADGAMFFLVAIYPLYLGIIVAGGDTTRAAAAVLGLLYPTIAFYRVRNLLFRVRNLTNNAIR